MDLAEQTDFHSNEKHVAFRKNGRPFYVPELFCLAPTFNAEVPLLIRDINEAVFSRSLYGTYDFRARNTMFVNNYPIQRVNAYGKILGEYCKTYESEFGREQSVAYITVDDSSGGYCSTVTAKMPLKIYESSGCVFGASYGVCVKLSGYVSESWHERILNVHKLEKLDSSDNLSTVISCWSATLSYRKSVLARPWVCDTSSANSLLQGVEHDNDSVILSDDYASSQYSFEKPRIVEESQGVLHEESISVMTEEPDEYSTNSKKSAICIIGVNEEPDFSLGQFQLTLQFINWIITHQFKPFKLSELFYDSTISHILDAQARIKIDPRQRSIDFESYNSIKYTIFHTVRHSLQIDLKLIRVTKSQLVTCDNLKKLYDHLKSCTDLIKKSSSHSTKILDVRTYIERMSANNIFGSTLDYKIINSIIDYIITNHFDEKRSWKYDNRTIQWIYRG